MFRERGFVPPVARYKSMMRDRQRRNETWRNRIIMIAFLMSIIFFLISSRPRGMMISGGGRLSINNENAVETALRGAEGRSWISLESQPFNQDQKAQTATHLVMVAGHSVTVSGHLQDAGSDESDWFLLDYQKHQGLPEAIKAHIQAGIDVVHNDPNALLIFSGGETRPVTGPMTEAVSYFHVADAMRLWPTDGTVRARSITEEFATDSFENLMFSICRFREVTGTYPKKITVVSFSFKRHRFETLHAPALGYDDNGRFNYIGVNPPTSTGFNLDRSIKGEMENAAAPFEKDPYGCNSPILQEKRKSRNPFFRTPPYQLSCPEMKELLTYCGPELFPKEKFPW